LRGLLRQGLTEPLLELHTGLCFRHAIAFLNLASQHLDIAFDLLDIVVSEFASLVVDASA
jgi:hypothetical protein